MELRALKPPTPDTGQGSGASSTTLTKPFSSWSIHVGVGQCGAVWGGVCRCGPVCAVWAVWRDVACRVPCAVCHVPVCAVCRVPVRGLNNITFYREMRRKKETAEQLISNKASVEPSRELSTR